MPEVRVLGVTRVSLPTEAATPNPVKLSFLDTLWISLPPIQRLFFYHTSTPLPSIIGLLKASLSQTLVSFYPLAAKLTYLPESGDIEVSFTGDDDGVDFLEAESDGDFFRLADDEIHDVEFFSSLVPKLETGELPFRGFSVQVTGFPGGGVAIGFSVHHIVADGRSVWQFMEAWAGTCRAGGIAEVVQPLHDRAVIRHPRGNDLSRRNLRDLAPKLPIMTSWDFAETRRQLTRRTFTIDGSNIISLKERADQSTGNEHGKLVQPPPSTFVALSAHFWISWLRAKGIDDDENTGLTFLVDCRNRVDPPISEAYFGNCVKPCMIEAKACDLLKEGGYSLACRVIREGIQECLKNPLQDAEDWFGKYIKVPVTRLVNVAASPRFQVYETDFGWGRPRRVELVSMNKDGEVVLVGARDEKGGVQASVAISPLHVEAFAAQLLGGL